MKFVISLCIGLTAIAFAQTPAPPTLSGLPPDTVIAEYDNGKKLTYGELEKFLSVLSAQQRQGLMHDRKQLVERYLLMKKVSELGEQDKLDQKSPYKEALESYRMNMLMQAEIQKVSDSFPIRVEDEQAYYEQHKSDYEQTTVKIIYISFSASASTGPDGKKRLNESEAKAKAEQLAKEAKGGADFVKLVKENSEDETTKAKDGNLTMSRSDNLPETIRTVAFALKPGEVSEPVREPNGFYIFRGESVSAKPFAEVRNEIVVKIQRAKTQAWIETTSKDLNIKPENDQFFSTPATQSAAPAPKAAHSN